MVKCAGADCLTASAFPEPCCAAALTASRRALGKYQVLADSSGLLEFIDHRMQGGEAVVAKLPMQLVIPVYL